MKKYTRGSSGPAKMRMPDNPTIRDLPECHLDEVTRYIRHKAEAVLSKTQGTIGTRTLAGEIAKSIPGVEQDNFGDACAYVGKILASNVALGVIAFQMGEACYVSYGEPDARGVKPFRWKGSVEMPKKEADHLKSDWERADVGEALHYLNARGKEAAVTTWALAVDICKIKNLFTGEPEHDDKAARIVAEGLKRGSQKMFAGFLVNPPGTPLRWALPAVTEI